MRVFMALFLALAAPIAAVADDVCEELWLTRNTVFDRAGYCFGSDLGRAVFDNSDCTATAPKLSSEGEAIVALVREVEVGLNCQVNTNRKTLKLDYVIERRALYDLAVNSRFESSCLGYKGPPLLLTAGRHPDTAISGEIIKGMDFNFGHIPVDSMDFIDLGDGQMGWINSRLISPDTCTAMAG